MSRISPKHRVQSVSKTLRTTLPEGTQLIMVNDAVTLPDDAEFNKNDAHAYHNLDSKKFIFSRLLPKRELMKLAFAYGVSFGRHIEYVSLPKAQKAIQSIAWMCEHHGVDDVAKKLKELFAE